MATQARLSAPYEDAQHRTAPGPRRLMRAGGSGRLSIIPSCVYDDVRVKPSAQRMLGVLGCYADTKTGMCRPDQRTLSARLGITRQAVSKALTDLAKAGYIEIIPRYSDFNGARLASHYRLIMDVQVPAEYRRTPPQPDVDGGQPEVDAPQPDVAYPRNLGDTPHQPDVAPIEEERPIGTTQGERPTGVKVAADAAPTPPPTEEAKAAAKPKRPRRSREDEGTLAPDTIELTDQSYATAARWGFSREDVAFQLERFLSKARAKGWRYLNWKEAFRNWLLNEVGYARRDGRPISGSARQTAPRPDDHLPSTVHRVPVERV